MVKELLRWARAVREDVKGSLLKGRLVVRITSSFNFFVSWELAGSPSDNEITESG